MELTNSLHIHENGIRASTNQTYLYLENYVPQSQDNLVEYFENMQISLVSAKCIWQLLGSALASIARWSPLVAASLNFLNCQISHVVHTTKL